MRLVPNLPASDFRNERAAHTKASRDFLTRAVCGPDRLRALASLFRAHPICVTATAAFWLGAPTVAITAREAFRLQPSRVVVPFGAGAMTDAILRIFKRRGPSQISGRIIRLAPVVVRHLMGWGRPVSVKGLAHDLMDKAGLVSTIYKKVHARIAGAAANRLREHFQPASAFVGNSTSDHAIRRDFIVWRYRDFLPSFHDLVVTQSASNCKEFGGGQ